MNNHNKIIDATGKNLTREEIIKIMKEKLENTEKTKEYINENIELEMFQEMKKFKK